MGLLYIIVRWAVQSLKCDNINSPYAFYLKTTERRGQGGTTCFFMIQNIWSRIVDWFSNVTDRRELLSSFNNAAKNAYILGITPTLIEARTSVGEISYRQEFSKFLSGGFRIKALSGTALTREEQMQIGLVILSDEMLVRHLISLGWDTLEVHDSVGKRGLKWELKKFSNIGGALSCGRY